MPNPPVVPREVVVSSSSLHPGGPQYRSRHPVETGAEARGMEAPARGGGADMEGVRPGTSGSVCVSRDVSLSTLVLPNASSSSRTVCDGADVAEASVRPLDAYIHRAAQWHNNLQLSVCFGPPNKGSPASKQRMSKWVVESISLAYESSGQPSPMAFWSHSTTSMATSKALISELLSKRFVMRQVSPHRTHSSDLYFGPGLYPRFPSALVLVLLFRFHTGQALVAMVVLYWRSPSVRIDSTRVPLKGNIRLWL